MSSEHESIHMSDPCHPGEVLRDWINGHGKTIQEAATLMGVSRATLNRLLSGAGRIAPKLAVQLERMGWSSAEMCCGCNWPMTLRQHGARNRSHEGSSDTLTAGRVVTLNGGLSRADLLKALETELRFLASIPMRIRKRL